MTEGKIAARAAEGRPKRVGKPAGAGRDQGLSAAHADIPDRQFITALARGLDILDCFSAARSSLGVTDIAAIVDLPQPTVWRLCHTMTTLGYLKINEQGRLQPALAALRLGYTVFSGLSVPELARPHLQQLADRVGGAAGIAVPDGTDMRFVERCESDSQLLMNLRVGSLVPMAISALGWAYLAGLPDGDRHSAASGVAQDHEAWRGAEKSFRRALKPFAQDGFILNCGVFHPGYNTAAAPVMGPGGRPLFAINCGGAASVLSVDRLRTEVGPKLRALAKLLEAVV
jgi:DNA-binding IclR family transcriptional regulator